MNEKKTIRLGGSDDNYIRPTKTYQQNLNENQIKEKLMEYKRIDLIENYKNIPLNCHIRYFNITDNNQKQFRLGGYLKKVDLDKRYCVLTNNKQSWCVNLDKSILFKKIDYNDYKNILEENSYLKSKLAETKDANSKLKSYINSKFRK
jgi:hypothetical protein